MTGANYLLAMKRVGKNILICITGGVVALAMLCFVYVRYIDDSVGLRNGIILNVGQEEVPLESPVRLIIPSIHVDANIIRVGLTPNGIVDVPKQSHDVAWFTPGPQPGQPGSSVIVGHYGQWQDGTSSVFDNLHTLKKGDNIYVKDDKNVVTAFVVREMHTYSPEDPVPSIFNRNDGTYLNLITCSGVWVPGRSAYSKRLVVFSDMVVQ